MARKQGQGVGAATKGVSRRGAGSENGGPPITHWGPGSYGHGWGGWRPGNEDSPFSGRPVGGGPPTRPLGGPGAGGGLTPLPSPPMPPRSGGSDIRPILHGGGGQAGSGDGSWIANWDGWNVGADVYVSRPAYSDDAPAIDVNLPYVVPADGNWLQSEGHFLATGVHAGTGGGSSRPGSGGGSSFRNLDDWLRGTGEVVSLPGSPDQQPGEIVGLPYVVPADGNWLQSSGEIVATGLQVGVGGGAGAPPGQGGGAPKGEVRNASAAWTSDFQPGVQTGSRLPTR
jgi:hypothetical protein